MRVQTFEKNKQKWRNQYDKSIESYEYMIKMIENGHKDVLEQQFQDFLNVKAEMAVTKDGFLYVFDRQYIYFVYHPTKKEPTIYQYNNKTKRVDVRKWDFWELFRPPSLGIAPPRITKDILIYIFSFLGSETILNCRYVCSQWNLIASDEHLWRYRLPSLLSLQFSFSPLETFIKFNMGYSSKEQLLHIARAWMWKFQKKGDIEYISSTKRKIYENICIREHVRLNGKIPIVWISRTNQLRLVDVNDGKKWIKETMFKFCDYERGIVN